MSGALDEGFLNPALTSGMDTLSQSETVAFVQYVRYVLPLDGYVFWLRTKQIEAKGVFHYSANGNQNETNSATINPVVFTTTTPIDDFEEIDPKTIWIGEYAGLKFSFAQRGFYFKESNVYHYAGNAVYATMQTQLVDTGDQLPVEALVVSNSLPAWLTIANYSPEWLLPTNPQVTLFPSFLVPQNVRPPYGVVHIDPRQTVALQAFPTIALRGTHTQLATDRVRVTLYGLTNDQALDWLDTVIQYSDDYSVIGMMNMPIVVDEKETQQEINTIAMKKVVDFEVSYTQARVRDVARQLILHALVTFIPNPDGVL